MEEDENRREEELQKQLEEVRARRDKRSRILQDYNSECVLTDEENFLPLRRSSHNKSLTPTPPPDPPSFTASKPSIQSGFTAEDRVNCCLSIVFLIV